MDHRSAGAAFNAALRAHVARGDRDLYGNQWGNPRHGSLRYLFERYVRRRKLPGDLSRVVKRFILPFVHADTDVLEIGSGGGRWTQFLLPARRIVVVEVAQETFTYLQSRFGPRFEPYLTSGAELHGIENASIDYVFSFGTFVHTPVDIIQGYLAEAYRVLRPGGVAVFQYADKSKPAARRDGPENDGFTDLNAPRFEALVYAAGLRIRVHERRLLNHSNIALLVRPPVSG